MPGTPFSYLGAAPPGGGHAGVSAGGQYSSVAGGGGGGLSISAGHGKKYDPLRQLAKYMRARRKATVPDLASQFNRQADTTIGAAGQSADQGQASYLANQRGGTGPGAYLQASENRANILAPAQAEASSLRTRGAMAQAEAQRAFDSDRLNEFQTVINLILQYRQQQQRALLQRLALQRSGGGGGGFSVVPGASYLTGGFQGDNSTGDPFANQGRPSYEDDHPPPLMG